MDEDKFAEGACTFLAKLFGLAARRDRRGKWTLRRLYDITA